MIMFGEQAYGPDWVDEYYDRTHILQILRQCELVEASFVALDQDRVIGILLCTRVPDIWLRRVYRLRELVWFIRPEYRSDRVGSRLLDLYEKTAQNQLDLGKITGFSLSKLAFSPDFDPKKRGYNLAESTYLRGQ